MTGKLTKWKLFHRIFFFVGALCGIGAVLSSCHIPILTGILGCVCFLGLVFGSIGSWDD